MRSELRECILSTREFDVTLYITSGNCGEEKRAVVILWEMLLFVYVSFYVPEELRSESLSKA